MSNSSSAPQVTRNQHYVPQFILRNFSQDRKHVALALLPEGTIVRSAKIAKQCQGSFFYGEDQVQERSFAREETLVSRLLGDLSNDHLASLDGAAIAKLIFFVHYQHARTQGSVEDMDGALDAIVKTTMRTSIKLNPKSDLSLEDLDLVKARHTNGIQESLWLAATSTPLLLDMNAKFIVTDRRPGFVISDHPVGFSNEYVEHHPDLQHLLSIHGLSAKGLQMFMPLSPRVVLAVFDGGAYQYGGASQVCRAGPADVDTLNRMQGMNAVKCVYFDDQVVDDAAVEKIAAQRRRDGSAYAKFTLDSGVHDRADGTKGQFVGVYTRGIRLGSKLSFVKHRDHRRYVGYDRAFAPVRNPFLLEFTEQRRRELDAVVDARRAERGLPPYYGSPRAAAAAAAGDTVE